MEPVAVVIPTLNEAGTIGDVVREIPRDYARDIIIADSGSTDGTQAIATEAGARVIDTGRGYGRACALGVAAADPACRVIVFLDGDGADRGDLIARIVDPVLAGRHDFVLASRTRGQREKGAMLWHQVLAGRLAGLGMGALYAGAPRDARDDLWLEHRDADEGRAGRASHSRSADALSPPRGGRVQGRGVAARDHAG
jgi:glycosyltransferase involved in cell wall biosynthesis